MSIENLRPNNQEPDPEKMSVPIGWWLEAISRDLDGKPPDFTRYRLDRPAHEEVSVILDELGLDIESALTTIFTQIEDRKRKLFAGDKQVSDRRTKQHCEALTHLSQRALRTLGFSQTVYNCERHYYFHYNVESRKQYKEVLERMAMKEFARNHPEATQKQKAELEKWENEVPDIKDYQRDMPPRVAELLKLHVGLSLLKGFDYDFQKLPPELQL